MPTIESTNRDTVIAAPDGRATINEATRYALKDANQALADLRVGKFEGAAVLVP